MTTTLVRKSAEAQDLGEAHVDLVHAIATERAGLDQIDSDVRRVPKGRPSVWCAESEDHVRGQRRPLVAAERPGDQHVHLGNVYERDRGRDDQPVEVLRHGLVGFCWPSTVNSGETARRHSS